MMLQTGALELRPLLTGGEMRKALAAWESRTVNFEGTVETAFLLEYRREAMRCARYAAAVAALLFAALSVAAWIGDARVTTVQVVRWALIALFAVLWIWLGNRTPFNVHIYVPIAASSSIVALIGAVFILQDPESSRQSAHIAKATPSVVIGLFMMYGFLRLPILVSAAIGVLVGAAAVYWAPVVAGENDTVRTTIYMCFANVLGLMTSVLTESRERELFLRRREAEEARREARFRLAVAEEAVAEKGRMIAAVSHDLRQPLCAASAFLGALMKRLADRDLDAAKNSGGRALDSVLALGKTLDQLEIAAKLEAALEGTQVRVVGLAQTMRSVLDAHWSRAEVAGVELRVKVPSGFVALRTDPRAVARALDNLVSNAIKFTSLKPEGRKAVLVAARLHGGQCHIEVCDTGPGITDEDSWKVWSPYVQLRQPHNDRVEGLGLGLYLVKSIVEQLQDHSVSLSSRPGRGSRFTLRVPVQEGVAASEIPCDLFEAGIDPQNAEVIRHAYVMIIEDDRDLRRGLEDLFGSLDVEFSSGANLEEVLRQHGNSERMVDAIVCDVRLQADQLGSSVVSALRIALDSSPDAIFISGDGGAGSVLANSGVDALVLKKPFSANELVELVARAVLVARQLESA
jgi:signal transduction histidine kinase